MIKLKLNPFKKKQKEAAGVTYLCLNIYPKSKGGVKYERLPANEISSEADLWRKAESGKYYYLHRWDKTKKALVPYYPLPEVIEIGADYVARMLTCPYVRLKALKLGIWGKLQAWIPFAVLGLAIFCLLVFAGG